MRTAATLGVALLAACAGAPRGPRDAAAHPRADLVALSRAMASIDALAERGGDELQLERQMRSLVAESEPRNAAARFLSVYAQPRGEERWAAFKQLARDFPDSPLGQLGMAGVYVDWRTLDQVDKAVAIALDLEPDNWIAVLHRAQAFEKREQLDFAIADYRTVLGADPRSPQAHLGLARVARRQGDAPRARFEANAALADAPSNVGALTLLAELAVEAGDARGSAAAWARVVEASPRDRRARLTLARLYRESAQPELARDQLKAAADLKEDAEVLGLLAEAARAAKDVRTEIEAVERLSGLDPSAAEWGRIGQMRLGYQDWDGAEKAFRRALQRDARDPAAQAGLGRIHLQRGQVQEAVEALRASGEAGRADLAALERRLNLDRVSRPDLNQLQRAVQALVDRTFRARAAEVPSLSGLLKVRVAVDPGGQATQVDIVEDTVHDADVRACAYWNLRDASYPQNKPVRVVFAFAFARR